MDKQTPKIFVSYDHEDSTLAEQLAKSLLDNGIDVFLDKYCLRAGDSLRQRLIDEGIGDCTHFLVLLTPDSVVSSWVKHEIDSALVRKLNGECRLIPVRYKLTVGELPISLQGTFAPEIKCRAGIPIIDQLVSDIHGVSRKPPLGSPPMAISQASQQETGYSYAVSAVAQLFVKCSKHALKYDLQLRIAEIIKKTRLTQQDIEDACHELKDDGFIEFTDEIGVKISDPRFSVFAQPSLFVEFDRFWMGWNPVDDGLLIANDIVSDPSFPTEPAKIADRYNWKPRRLNPAIYYIEEQGLVKAYRALGTGEFCVFFIEGNRSRIRRLIKSMRSIS